MDTDDGIVTDAFTGDEAEGDEFSAQPAAIENDVVSLPPSPSLPIHRLSEEDRTGLHHLSRLTCPQFNENQNGAVGYDVLSVILEHLSLSYGESLIPRRKMFRALCIVSKLFFEAASSFLWSDLNSMIPLLSLFPSFKKMGDGIYYVRRFQMKGYRSENFLSFTAKHLRWPLHSSKSSITLAWFGRSRLG